MLARSITLPFSRALLSSEETERLNLVNEELIVSAVHGVAKSRTRLSNFTFTFHFPALEKEMATHSSVLAWRIPGTGEPGGLLSMGLHRVGYDWSDLIVVVVDVNNNNKNLVTDPAAGKFFPGNVGGCSQLIWSYLPDQSNQLWSEPPFKATEHRWTTCMFYHRFLS